MATSSSESQGDTWAWSTIAMHDWDGPASVEMTLVSALEDLNGSLGEDVLYDHVDLDAVTDTLAPTTERGATEVRFQYGSHELRLERDGTISAR